MADISVLNFNDGGGNRTVKDSNSVHGISINSGTVQTPTNNNINLTISASTVGAIASSDKGVANGVASLDSNGKVPSSQLPSSSASVTGVKGDNESTYRAGDVNITKDNIGLGNVGNYKAVSTEANQDLSDTEKSQARSNIGAGTSNFSGSYSDLTNKPTASDIGAIPTSSKGANGGVAELDSSGKVPSSQLPAYPSAASSAPGDITTNAALTGTSTNYARQDHIHKIPTATTSVYGATKLNSSIDSASTTEAATPSAVKALKEALDEKIAKTGSPSGEPKTAAYADIVSISDAIAVNAKDIKIKIDPVQAGSGTPSPDNIRAISGWSSAKVVRAGKNLIPNGTNTSNGYVANSFLKSDGTTGASNDCYVSEYFLIKAGAEYTYSDKNRTSNSVSVCFYDANKTYISGVAMQRTIQHITTPTNAVYARCTQFKDGNTDNNIQQFEAGNTATECVPFVASEDYTIQLGDTYYGGTLDVTTGVLTVDRIFKEYDGTEAWDKSASFSNTYYVAYPSGINTTSAANVSYGMCNAYAYADPGVSLGTQDNVYLLGSLLNIRDTVNGTSLSDWKNYVANHHLQFIFPLATPQVIQLTPTQIRMLAGVNTVYANTGDTQVEYFNASVGNLGEVLGDVQGTVLNEVTTRAQLGAHNLGKKYNGVTSIGITLKDAPDGGNYVNGTATGGGGRLNLKSDNFVLKAGTYSIVGESNDHSKYSAVVLQKTADNSVLGSYLINNGTVDKSQATVTLVADTECYFGFNTSTGTAYGTDTFIIYPMVKVADDKDDTFQPYAMTNKELTEDIALKANKSETVSTVAWDSTNKKLTKTINGTTSDVVTGATILNGLTKAQVTTALGYTPSTTPTTLSATLAANATSVSFTDALISTTAMIDVYTSVPNLNYMDMTVSGTTLTLTYPKQSDAVTVKIVIST